MTNHDQDEPVGVKVAVRHILDAQDPQYVCCCLHASANYDDEAVRFTMYDHLSDMDNGRQAEEHCVQLRSSNIRTKVSPIALWVGDRCERQRLPGTGTAGLLYLRTGPLSLTSTMNV